MSDSRLHAERRRYRFVVQFLRRAIPLTILLVGLLGVYLFWRDRDHSPRPETAPVPQKPVPVNVVVIQTETAPVRMRFLGRTEAAQVVEIRARVAGYLQPRLFTEGEPVKKGQKLFQIDPRPFQVELAQAEAGLASAEAALQRAQQQLRRLQTLSSRQAVAQEQIEEAQAQERIAAAAVAEQRARIAAAELQLSYTSIEAPIDGVIGQALKDTGSYVDAGQNGLLAVVQQIDPIYVRYAVTETEILRFQRQTAEGKLSVPEIDELELEITLSDGTIYPYRGRINFLDVKVDETTGTSIVRGEAPNPDGRLRPGQFIYASVLGIQRVNVVRVPQKAVNQSPTGASVYVVNDQNQVETRPVILGEWSGTDHWIVEQGLEPGDRVIIDRLMTVRPGMLVTVAHARPSGEVVASGETTAMTASELSSPSGGN